MKKDFTKEELKSGMIVEITEKIEDGEKTYLALVIDSLAGLCISSPEMWFPVSKLTDNLYKTDSIKITKVYGKSFPINSYKIAIYSERKLIWERNDHDA